MKIKLIAWGIGLLLAASMLTWLLQSPAAPYNLRELAAGRPLAGAALSLLTAFVLAFGPPAWMGIRLVRCRRSGDAYLWGLGLLGHAALIYLLVRLSFPLESLDALIGPPTLGWPGEWERLVRFSALFLPFSLMTAGGTALIAVMRSPYVRVFGRWLVLTLPVLPLSWWLVVGKASTPNVVDMIAGHGHPAAALFVLGWWFVLALGAAALAARIAGFVQEWTPVVILLVLGLPVAYVSIYLGTNQAISGYGAQFSALQYLLSADRTHYVTGLAFWLRYLLTYLGLLGLLVIAQLPLWLGAVRGLGFASAPLVLADRRG